jgi:predicted nucleic acid-binding Zn ribbon protein
MAFEIAAASADKDSCATDCPENSATVKNLMLVGGVFLASGFDG